MKATSPTCSAVVPLTSSPSAASAIAPPATRRYYSVGGTALEVILLLISGLGIQFPRGAQTGFDQAKRSRSRGAASSTALSHPWWMAASPGSGNDLSCGPSHEVFVPATGAPRPSPATWKQRGCWPSMLAGADLLTLTRADIDGFVADQLTRHRPTTAAVRFRSLQQFYRWAVEEELLPTSPMTGLRPPSIPDAPVPILDERSIKALLAAMNGRGFDDRCDTAIVRLFLDTGMRVSEMAGLSVADIDLGMDAVVLGKGRRPRACPFGEKTGQAIERATSESE
jgi:hypothetical protein